MLPRSLSLDNRLLTLIIEFLYFDCYRESYRSKICLWIKESEDGEIFLVDAHFCSLHAIKTPSCWLEDHYHGLNLHNPISQTEQFLGFKCPTWILYSCSAKKMQSCFKVRSLACSRLSLSLSLH